LDEVLEGAAPGGDPGLRLGGVDPGDRIDSLVDSVLDRPDRGGTDLSWSLATPEGVERAHDEVLQKLVDDFGEPLWPHEDEYEELIRKALDDAADWEGWGYDDPSGRYVPVGVDEWDDPLLTPASGVAREAGEAVVKDAVPEGKILADQRGYAVSEDLHGQPGSVGYADAVGESQYVDFIEVRLPATFMEDHIWNRALPGGVEVKSLKTVWVRRLTASDIREIYSDADFYSDAATAAEMGLRGLAASARATVKALRKALGVPEGAPFPSRAEIEATLAAMGG
jgi:hypothetical protein